MLAISLKEKSQRQSSGTGKSSTTVHHHSEIFLKTTSVFLSRKTGINVTHSCFMAPHTTFLQHEL